MTDQTAVETLDTTKNPSSASAYLASFSGRLLALLILLFLALAVIVYAVIAWQGKPRIQAMSSQIMIETGNEAVNDLLADINLVDGLAMGTTAMASALPKDEALFEQSIGAVMNQAEGNVVGGGVWFNPNLFDADTDRKSFVWERDANGQMVQTLVYDDEARTEDAYYREWWFIPTMYAEHDHCVWSRAYVDASTGEPMMTCATAMRNAQNYQFDAVVSFNVLLADLGELMQSWQERTGGYVFLMDMDNRFLTFPDVDRVMQVTELNPQGEKMHARTLAQSEPSFAPIADSLDKLNQNLIAEAKAINEGQHTMTAVNIQTTANAQRISQDEAQVLSAMMMTNTEGKSNDISSNFVEAIDLPQDFMLGEPATAFVFRMPSTNWKMVIVKPQRELLAVADDLSRQLMLFMGAGLLLALMLAGWAFRRYLTRPLRQVVQGVSDLSHLIANKRYLELGKHKLPLANVTEISTINHSVNQLVDRVVENEGALAEVNVYLEKKVDERTEELKQAMTDLKASQVQLVQSEKMATLGQMVAGVAHEVNTPLGYVRSNLSLVNSSLARFDELIDAVQTVIDLQDDKSNASDESLQTAYAQVLEICRDIQEDEVGDDLRELVGDSLYGVDQIAELVVSLKDFSRIDASKIKAVDLNECIHNSLTMAKNNIKYLTIHQDLGDLPTVTCNPSQINQILLNLFNNASQAIPEGKQGEICIKSYATDDEVVISVADNGTGMPKSVMDKIFEPFFTTKKAGEGTGLGLAISSQIMEAHHGTIEVESDEGVGTTFILSFPQTQPDPPASESKDKDKSTAVFIDGTADDAVFI